MRIAVIADIHGNLPALRAVLDDIAGIGCDAIWCAGDLVGRGPHPNEVIATVRELGIATVQGNWDEAVGMGREQAGAIWATEVDEAAGRASLDWSIRTVTEEHRAWLRQLPVTLRLSAEGRSILLFHATPIKQTEYLWADRPSRTFARIASDAGDDLFCFGHTHETVHKLVGQAHFVACGSVGCGAHARARYAVIYLGQPDLAIGFRSVDYDSTGVASDLAAAGLPMELLKVPPVAHPIEPERGPAAEPPAGEAG